MSLSNHTDGRAPPLSGVAGNVLVFPERFFLTQISAFAAGRDSRATATHLGIHLFPSGDSGSSGSPPGLRCRQSPSRRRILGRSQWRGRALAEMLILALEDAGRSR